MNDSYTEVTGRVEDLIYVNSDNGFTVIDFLPSGSAESIRAAGIMPDLFPGELITLTGKTENHIQYGETFRVFQCTKTVPSDGESLVTFLSCGLFSGVGDVTAKAIVDRFGDRTYDIILGFPERLSEVRGISRKKAEAIAETFRTYCNFSETLKFFSDLGVSTTVAMAVYNKYGLNSVAVTKRNPYILIDEVPKLNFKTADKIAVGIGIGQNAGSRVTAFIKYYLRSQLNYGNVCYPKKYLTDSVAYELETDAQNVSDALDALIASGEIRIFETGSGPDTEQLVFLEYTDMCEQYIADRLSELNVKNTYLSGKYFERFISKFADDTGFELSAEQVDAVRNAVENGFSVITGGPGTGKTTIIKALYRYLSGRGLKCMLAAPTGRAAKRMNEAVGIAARTIHRMLEYAPYSFGDNEESEIDDEKKLRFNRNEENPLDADVLIIDESSMLDTFIAYHMLKALKPGAKLVMLGDKDQLPSVGPGNLLKDVIASNRFPVSVLTYVYRQSDSSLIPYNAQRINMGQIPELNRRDKDFFMIDCPDPASVIGTLRDVVKDRLPDRYGIDPLRDVQVLVPGKKGNCGTVNLNSVLQQSLNPAKKGGEEVVFGDNTFRKGDRVMQIKNNYDIDWINTSVRGVTGKGIFNGEMGIIEEIDRADRTVTVLFDDEKIAEYTFELLSQLELCYAITVHKSQGSEFDYCVVSLFDVPERLQTRNILYTAVTRAKKMIVLIGDRNYLRIMAQNNTEARRYTCLKYRLGSGGGSDPERQSLFFPGGDLE